jgi:hypothetical protein
MDKKAIDEFVREIENMIVGLKIVENNPKIAKLIQLLQKLKIVALE